MKKVITLILAIMLPCCAIAQQKATGTPKKTTTTVKNTTTPSSSRKATTPGNLTTTPAEPPQSLLSPQEERMLSGLEKVIIFDSLVVSKRDLFKAYPLSPSAGTLAWTDGNATWPDSLLTLRPTCHTIAYGDKRIEACPVDSACSFIGFSMHFSNQWTPIEPIFSDDSGKEVRQNFPYLMADGQTIYFAQEAADGLGGLDLYMTRQNTDRSEYYRPENIGMPFNSSANDYLLVIDEESGFGMFASDRRQPDGYVCVYYFIPSELRNTYDEDNLSQEQRITLAKISRISDTWPYGNQEEIDKFRERLHKSLSLAK